MLHVQFLSFSLVYTACHDSQPSVQISSILALRTLSKQDELRKVSIVTLVFEDAMIPH